jgi:predicted nucleic acid-binding protein
MYLVDTDVLSEIRKDTRANAGVRELFVDAEKSGTPLFLSVITIGEIRCGVARIRHRGDEEQAVRLERWLHSILQKFDERILPFDVDSAQTWGQLRGTHPGNPIDKQIAATALVHGLTVITGNTAHYVRTGATLRDPFSSRAG